MGFSTAEEILRILKRKLGLDENIYTVMQIWERDFSPLTNYAKLIGIKKGELVIEVESSVHFQELYLSKKDIITKINQHFGKNIVIKNIKLQIKK